MLLESVFTGSTRLLLEKMIYVLIIVVIASVIAKMIATATMRFGKKAGISHNIISLINKIITYFIAFVSLVLILQMFNFDILTTLELENIKTWVDIGSKIAVIFALGVSLYTVYSLYLIPGTIQIDMPNTVGLNLNGSPAFFIYPTFSNDGSPNKWKTIKTINATGRIYRDGKKPEEPIQFQWRYVFRFVSIEEYERNYKRSNEAIPSDSEYQTIFESINTPFSVPGKQTVSKLLKFGSSPNDFNFSESFTFEIQIEATTMDNKIYYSPKIRYRGSGLDAMDITTRPLFYRWLPQTTA